MKNLLETLRLLTHVGLETLYRIQKGLSALMLVGVVGFMLGVHGQMIPLGLHPWLVKGAMLWGLLGVGFWRNWPIGVKRLWLLLLVSLVGFFLAVLRFHPVYVPDYLNGQYLRLPGKISPHEKGLILETAHLDTATPVRLLLKTSHPSDFPLGKATCISGHFEKGHALRFLGDFNEAQYLQSMGMAGTLRQAFLDQDCLQRLPLDASLPKPTGWEHARAGVESAILKQRLGFVTLLERTLGPEAGRLMGGIVLGDRASPLPPALKQAFIDTGQIHLVAASGMNVAIIAAGLLFLLRLVPRFPRAAAFALASLGVLAYGVATGFPPSILRAVVMWFLGLWVKYFFKPLNPLFLLMLAISVISVWQPYLWLNLGFQLSVLTTFGIVTLFSTIEAFLQKKGWNSKRNLIAGLLSAGCLTAVAQLYATPLILHVFHKTPLHAVAMNLLSGILVAPLTLWGFASFGLYSLSPSFAGLCLMPSQLLLKAQIAWTHWGASFSHLQFRVPTLPLAWMLLAYMVLLSLPWWGERVRRATQSLRGTLIRYGGISLISLALMLFPLYWDATRFQRHPQQAWVRLPIGQSLRHEGVRIFHYKDAKNVQKMHSIVFVEAPLSRRELEDVNRYFDAQHLQAPEEVVWLEASALKALQKSEAPKKRKRKRAKKTTPKALLSPLQKHLRRVEKTVHTLAKGDVTYLIKGSQTKLKQPQQDLLESEQAMYTLAFFEDDFHHLKVPKTRSKAQKLFTTDSFDPPPLAPQGLQRMKRPQQALEKTNTTTPLTAKEGTSSSHSPRKRKASHNRKRSHSSAQKTPQTLKQKQARQDARRRAFEENVLLQWNRTRFSTFPQHRTSYLKWQAKAGKTYELSLPVLGFTLRGHWQAYPTAKGVRVQLMWTRV